MKQQNDSQHKKKWNQYFFEFFMLFLAVSAGFMAENLREGQIEKEREKAFMQSMVEDLKADTAKITDMVYNNKITLVQMDSLIHMLRMPSHANYTGRMYYLARIVTVNTVRIELYDRTYEQMKSSGMLRLISDHSVSDSITKYYADQPFLKQQLAMQLTKMTDYTQFAGNLFDAAIFQDMLQRFPVEVLEPSGNPLLLTNDSGIINEFIGRIHYFSAVTGINTTYSAERKEQTIRLIQLLQSKYRLI